MSDESEEDFVPLEDDDGDEPTTRSFPLPRADIEGAIPTHLDRFPEFEEAGDEEQTERSSPRVGEAAEPGPHTELDAPRFADDDENDTELNEFAVSAPDDDGVA